MYIQTKEARKPKRGKHTMVKCLTIHNSVLVCNNSFLIHSVLDIWKLYLYAWMSIPYRTGRTGRNIPYRPAIRYTQPSCFVPEKIPAVPVNFGQYRAYRPVQEKIFFFFFLSFVIFEFLLGQNGNLFVLTY